ncbi:MAG: ComF family protein [Lachnospiraceae bacterium]|nr:ComF family protein [Lachnospiraceae bacterium]
MNRKMFLKEAGRKRVPSLLLDVLYPPRCPFCGEAVPVGQRYHSACAEKIPRIRGMRCQKCGKPTAEGEKLCGDCSAAEHRFDAGFGAFVYDGAVRDALLALKFRGKKEYADVLGEMTAEEAGEFLREQKIVLFLPVPMHRKKQKFRGYNQAGVLADAISFHTGIPVLKNTLVRTRGTSAMKTLGVQERRENLRGAFLVRDPLPVRGKKICLIDDIYTTGATADGCAEACFAAGAAGVCVLTAGIGDDR